MATTPLTGSRYPVSSDSANVAQYFANLALDLDDNTIPRFTTSTARDTAYSSWVTLGGTMADGMQCVVNGLPYRRIAGTWRQDNGPRVITRNAAPGTSIASGGGNETGVTSGIPALSSFTLYEAATVGFTASFRAGGAGAIATCYVKIDGSQVGNSALTRSDDTTVVVGAIALASGSHTLAAHVDASGAITWTDFRIVLTVGQAE